jgi:heat shock protein HslJ
MKTTLWLLPLVLGLAACETYPTDPYYGGQPYPPEPYPGQYPAPYPPQQPYPPAPYPGQQATYRAIGTEPFWDLDIGPDLVFTDRGNGVSVTQPTPAPINGTAGEIYRSPRIEVNITHIRCSDGMSDRSYPDTVQVYVDGKMYRGCGAPTAFFTSTDERGNPLPPPQAYPPAAPMGVDGPPLDGTRWQVVAINGRPTPRTGNFSMEFTSGRMSATFGCNGLGASYTQTGATLDAGPVIGTKMACADMSWERDGGKVLDPVMTVRLLDPNRVTIQSSGGSIEMVRR